MRAKLGVILLSALVAHTAWHWMTERGATLLEFPIGVPDAATALAIVRWLMAAVAAAGVWWLVRSRRQARERQDINVALKS